MTRTLRESAYRDRRRLLDGGLARRDKWLVDHRSDDVVMQNLTENRLREFVCDDCMDGDHEECRRQGGWPFQDTNERCGCHQTCHTLDNRART